MAQKKRSKSRRSQRPRPPGSRPGTAQARSNGRQESGPELNGGVADPLADAAAELDEREAALERERAEQLDGAVGAASAEPDDGDAPAETDDADARDFDARDFDEAPAGLESDEEDLEAPAALEHATPDVEIAEAQIALGAYAASEIDEDGDEESERDAAPASAPAPRARRRSSREVVEEEEEEATAKSPGAARQNPIVRLAHFVQGSWRELQRVQWPDRRQVMQATGVVIGFVIVAGVFLGVSDWLAGKLVNWILG